MDCPPALHGFQAGADIEGGPTPLRDSTPCRPKVSPPPHSLVKIFPKRGRKRIFWNVFFKNLPAVQKIWPKQGLFGALGELRKSI